MHDLEIADKKLVAKVDAKNKLLLDNYKEEEQRNAKCEMFEKREDADVVQAIRRIIAEHRADIENFESRNQEQNSNKMLQSVAIEEEKRDLINREIGKFRKTAEADEQKKEKEKDRRKREEKDRDRRKRDDKEKEEKVVLRRRSRSKDRERERERERELRGM